MSPLRGLLGSGESEDVDGLEVVVLGSAGTHPGPGRACSGYLFRSSDARVVVDMGYGSTSNLYRMHDPDEIDAVVLTHQHADHCVDIVGLYYALRFHPDGPQRIDVHAPQGVEEFIAQLVPSDSTPPLREILEFHKIEPGDELIVGDIGLTFHASIHPVPTVTVRADHEGRIATYSSDSAGGSWLETAARDADLFICEASWLGDPEDYPDGVHLTAAQAGEVAAKAGARQLVLTHIWPRNDPEQSREAAQGTYGGEVHLAEDGQVWNVTAPDDE
jgi:ribonuclease BN (tRNA processing enzyme)